MGGHRHTRLALGNSMANECSTARGRSGTVMRHFFSAGPLAAPAPVTPLAFGMTVPAASRVLIPAPRRAQRLTPSEAATTRRAVALPPVTARADEHLALAPCTQEQPGIVHRSSRRGGLDDPRSPGNTALGAVHQCGSGRSLGRDRQVNTVRGCVGLLAACDLTAIAERRHRMGARTRPLLSGHIGSGGTHRWGCRDDSEQIRSDPADPAHKGCSPNTRAFTSPPTRKLRFGTWASPSTSYGGAPAPDSHRLSGLPVCRDGSRPRRHRAAPTWPLR